MAKQNLDSLGYARVYRHPRTGELVVDTDSLRRGEFAGEDDDFGEDGVEGDDDGVEGDDDGVEGEEVGARGRGKRRRLNRRLRRLDRREDRVRDRLDNLNDRRGRRREEDDVNWGMTAVAGTDVLGAAGAASVKIRLQHDFRAQDVTFTGSASGAKVTSIFFGDRVVWSSSDGIDVSVFGSTSFLRGLLKGQSLRAGLDITVNGSLGAAGDFAVTIVGEKPVTPHC
jgi:hypothetical protein